MMKSAVLYLCVYADFLVCECKVWGGVGATLLDIGVILRRKKKPARANIYIHISTCAHTHR